MKKLILLGLLLSSSQVAMAVNWVNTGVTGEQKQIIWIDIDSISGYYFNNYDKNNYYVTAWLKFDYPTSQKLRDGRSYHQVKELWYFDCLAGKSNYGDVVFYASNGNLVVSGKNNHLSTYSSSNWDRIVPDTVADGLSKTTCNFYNIKSAYQTK
ncbi:surface-adhesin E family protein [Moraxella nonliquefaciens]|uniref:Surface-adhesin protein E-like domain-containing protein n=1 Tax=Moraxella nonliquefaciens TaxID=478 RepID=A0A1B8QKN3_MORNO|nr:surface-adhesin E family protein [Moraxella nonliquefaciens]OBX84032.1 hypothetical protein A7456_02890 [Moraxella nonliquefaciens]QPT44716.1 hypothetical protein I6G26_01320 [Moraxella nonliquefaciens]QQC29736.1 hypothetical protein I6H63_10780 [Moraxella nonliquefaciens]